MSPNQAGVYTVSAILSFASTLAVGLRFQARRIKKASFGSDDYLSALSMLFVWGFAILLIVGAARGTLGTHTQRNPNTGAVIVTWHEIDTSKLAGISQILTIPALGVLKLSVVLLYRRIFTSQRFRIASLIVMILIALWTIAFFFATIFECGSNLGLLWHSLQTFKADCGKYKYIQLGHAASDVATDLIVLVLPLSVIWTLRMTGTQKLALSLIFLLGLLSTAAATARLVIIAEDIYETATGARDVRGVETNAIVWTYVEIGVGVVASCLPTLRPIFNRRTPESIVNSVRSAVTLNSLNSAGRQGELETGLEIPSTNLKEYERPSHTRLTPDTNSTTVE